MCRDLKATLQGHSLAGKADGILLDLGISSMQVDQAERGFAFSHDGPLDMRMDTSGSFTAADLVNSASEQELGRVIREYGEEKAWKIVVRRIVDARCAAVHNSCLSTG